MKHVANGNCFEGILKGTSWLGGIVWNSQISNEDETVKWSELIGKRKKPEVEGTEQKEQLVREAS